MALASIFMGVGGLVQVQNHRQQSGRALAIVGILVSLLTLVLTVVLLVTVAMPVIKAHDMTTTEQTSNDSQ
jgi:predicted exporter